MGTAASLIAQAVKWLGYKEGPNNDTIFGKRTGFPNQAWCGSFVDCMAKDAGVELAGSCVSTVRGAKAFQKANRWFADPTRGDIVFFKFGSGIDHCGIVTSTRLWRTGYVRTIEGNTGDSVRRRIRSRKSIAGFGRPVFITN